MCEDNEGSEGGPERRRDNEEERLWRDMEEGKGRNVIMESNSSPGKSVNSIVRSVRLLCSLTIIKEAREKHTNRMEKR